MCVRFSTIAKQLNPVFVFFKPAGYLDNVICIATINTRKIKHDKNLRVSNLLLMSANAIPLG